MSMRSTQMTQCADYSCTSPASQSNGLIEMKGLHRSVDVSLWVLWCQCRVRGGWLSSKGEQKGFDLNFYCFSGSMHMAPVVSRDYL